jgi:uncharacterized RDD family membrane protein YckC
MTQYWVIRGGERRGPYEESDVLEGVELGTVRPHDLLWVDGMREGVPIAEVIANLGSVPPSKPPLTLQPAAPRLARAASSPYRPPAARVDDLAELALGNIAYAGFWVRFTAMMLDTLILLAIAVVLGFALALLAGALGLRAGPSEALYNLAGFALSLAYYAFLESGPRCATFGKRALHLQVLGAADLTRMGFLRAAVRWFGRFASMILLMAGYLMQPFTPRKRALHDYIAGTVVVVQAPYSRTLVGLMIGLMVLLVLAAMVAGVMVGYQDYAIRRRG